MDVSGPVERLAPREWIKYCYAAHMQFPRLLWVARSIVSLILGAALLSGCKNKHPDNPAQVGRKVLVYGNASEPQFLDPQLLTGSVEHALARAFFEGLVNASKVTGEIVPGVAEKWEISDDRLVYTFHLRSDAKWSNGTAVVANDFVRSYQRMLTPAVAADYVYMLYPVKGAEDYYNGRIKDFSQTGFQAPDDHTLILTLSRPTPFLLSTLAQPAWDPLPIATLEKFHDLDRRDVTWTRPENIVGNGPFIMKEWRQNQKIVAEKSSTYWDRANVKLDQIDFLPIESADTEERMFRTGQIDITYEVPLTKIAMYQRERPKNILLAPWCSVYFYRFNVARKPLDDVRVRRALSMAIERDKLVKYVTLGDEQPALSIVPPDTAGYVGDYKLHENVTEAKKLLAEAGFPNGKGFPHIQLLYNTSERHRPIAEAIQEMWRRNLGIEITLTNEEWKVFLADQRATNFDMQRAGWQADYLDPNVFFDLWKTGGGNNCTNWGSPEYDHLLDVSFDAKTRDERYATYRRMEKLILDESPIIPIFFYTDVKLISDRVLAYKITPLDDFPWKDVDVVPTM